MRDADFPKSSFPRKRERAGFYRTPYRLRDDDVQDRARRARRATTVPSRRPAVAGIAARSDTRAVAAVLLQRQSACERQQDPHRLASAPASGHAGVHLMTRSSSAISAAFRAKSLRASSNGCARGRHVASFRLRIVLIGCSENHAISGSIEQRRQCGERNRPSAIVDVRLGFLPTRVRPGGDSGAACNGRAAACARRAARPRGREPPPGCRPCRCRAAPRDESSGKCTSCAGNGSAGAATAATPGALASSPAERRRRRDDDPRAPRAAKWLAA